MTKSIYDKAIKELEKDGSSHQKKIKLLSTIGPRASFGMAALDLVKKYNDLMILTCDVSTSAGLDRYRKSFSKIILI